MKLRTLAQSRTDDRGVLVNVWIIAFDARDYPRLERTITAGRVRDHLAGLVQRTVVRYAWPHLGALSFMVWPVGGHGVSRNLGAQTRVKSITSALLSMELPERKIEDVLPLASRGDVRPFEQPSARAPLG